MGYDTITTMKILIVTTCFPRPDNKGAGIFVYHRAKALIDMGHEVEVLTLNNLFNSRLKLSFLTSYTTREIGFDCPINVTVKQYQKMWSFSDGIAARLVARHARMWGADVVHVHMLSDALMVPALRQILTCPIFITCHGSDVNRFPHYSTNKQARCLAALNTANTVVFVSQRLKEKAESFGFTGHGVVLPNGYDPHLFSAPEEPISRDSDKRFRIGFVGNLAPVKRAESLPSIFRYIHNTLPNARFFVAGKGPLDARIRLACQDLPVSFLGYVPPKDLGDYLRDWDVLVLPSRSEGFPCIIVESLACHTPVVGSDVGGIPDAIGPFGTIVTDGPDFESRFADACVALCQTAMNMAQVDSHISDYTWNAVVAKELSVYTRH